MTDFSKSPLGCSATAKGRLLAAISMAKANSASKVCGSNCRVERLQRRRTSDVSPSAAIACWVRPELAAQATTCGTVDRSHA